MFTKTRINKIKALQAAGAAQINIFTSTVKNLTKINDTIDKEQEAITAEVAALTEQSTILLDESVKNKKIIKNIEKILK